MDSPARPATALQDACLSMAAALGALACTWSFAPTAGAAVLTVVLCLALARSERGRDRRGRIVTALLLPVIGLAATAAGALLQHLPVLGALAFCAAMFVSIWVRRFGPLARRGGALLALPFVAILVTPRGAAVPVGALPAWLTPVLIAALAVCWVNLVDAAGRRFGWLPPGAGAAPAVAPPAASSLRPQASTRLAMQMAVSLGLAFAVGMALYAERWGWIVLTAFLVASGNRGRLDVAYKSLLRVAGAAAGTVLALVLGTALAPHGPPGVALILGALFLGVWLRPFNYAWWALWVTVALALLQGFSGAAAGTLLVWRMEEIVLGAVIAVAVAWLVWPVRSSDIVRRRLADALAALAAALDPGNDARSAAGFVAALQALEETAPPFRLARALTRRYIQPQPADWLDCMAALRAPALQLIEAGAAPAQVRRALGAARQALREPAALTRALEVLRGALAQA